MASTSEQPKPKEAAENTAVSKKKHKRTHNPKRTQAAEARLHSKKSGRKRKEQQPAKVTANLKGKQ